MILDAQICTVPRLEAPLPKDQNGSNGWNGLEWQGGLMNNYYSGLDA